MVENVHIVQPHAAQALIQAGNQVLAAAPVAVGACPHFITSLGRDDQLVAVDAQIVPQDFAKVFLGGAGLRAVVVGQIKVSDAVVERGAAERTHILVGGGIAEIVPQPQRDGGQQQPAGPAAAVGQALIAVLRSLVHDENLLLSGK